MTRRWAVPWNPWSSLWFIAVHCSVVGYHVITNLMPSCHNLPELAIIGRRLKGTSRIQCSPLWSRSTSAALAQELHDAPLAGSAVRLSQRWWEPGRLCWWRRWSSFIAAGLPSQAGSQATKFRGWSSRPPENGSWWGGIIDDYENIPIVSGLIWIQHDIAAINEPQAGVFFWVRIQHYFGGICPLIDGSVSSRAFIYLSRSTL